MQFKNIRWKFYNVSSVFKMRNAKNIIVKIAMVTREERGACLKGIIRAFFLVPAHHLGASTEYSSRGVQGVIIFPALILMAG